MYQSGMKRWRVLGTIITPLHIGNGETLDPFSCIYEAGELIEFDYVNALQHADEPTRARIENYLSSRIETESQADQVRKLLWELPWRNHILRKFNVSYQIKVALANDQLKALRNREIYLFANNPRTRERIIPGSSLKGAMRTGWVNKRSLGRKSHGKFEPDALGYLEQKIVKDKMQDVVRMEGDPFGEWKIADAKISGISELAAISIYRRKMVRKGEMMFEREQRQQPVPPNPHFFETVAGEGQTYDFETKMTFFPRKSVKDHISLDQWIKAINEHSRESFKSSYNGVQLQDASKEFRENIEELENTWFNADNTVRESRKSCILSLGRFTGFLSKTASEHRKHEIKSRGPKQFKYGKDANPITRILSEDSLPLGFVKLEFDEIK